MRLVVSDANILIDFIDGGLSFALSCLPYEIVVPEIIFEEELEARHSELLNLGIIIESSSEEVTLVVTHLTRKYPRISRNDAFALALAKEKRCILLTGDKNLRIAANESDVEVHGTLYMLEELRSKGTIGEVESYEAIELMRARGRRLPWNLVERNIKFRQ